MDKNNTPHSRPVPPILKTLGIKDAEKGLLDFLRVVFVLLLSYAIVALILKSNAPRVYTLDDISDVVKPDSIIYRSICELDEGVRSPYILSIKKSFDNPPKVSKKLSRTVAASIMTAMLSEFIVSGNVTKPSNVVAKTFIFAVLNMFFS